MHFARGVGVCLSVGSVTLHQSLEDLLLEVSLAVNSLHEGLCAEADRARSAGAGCVDTRIIRGHRHPLPNGLLLHGGHREFVASHQQVWALSHSD
ncbi:hypothetical protein BaRGS_00020068 [Batillaria attramentaria]|uniref:Uncharacterized protein n=1 Tax=Batillaria attramentaria TaxID=370345 RepID=A0ABD0KNK6_9CAEN